MLRTELAVAREDLEQFIATWKQKFLIAQEKHNKIVHYYATDWYDETHCVFPKVGGFKLAACYDYDSDAAERP